MCAAAATILLVVSILFLSQLHILPLSSYTNSEAEEDREDALDSRGQGSPGGMKKTGQRGDEGDLRAGLHKSEKYKVTVAVASRN